jgi:hypothetical protein
MSNVSNSPVQQIIEEVQTTVISEMRSKAKWHQDRYKALKDTMSFLHSFGFTNVACDRAANRDIITFGLEIREVYVPGRVIFSERDPQSKISADCAHTELPASKDDLTLFPVSIRCPEFEVRLRKYTRQAVEDVLARVLSLEDIPDAE